MCGRYVHARLQRVAEGQLRGGILGVGGDGAPGGAVGGFEIIDGDGQQGLERQRRSPAGGHRRQQLARRLDAPQREQDAHMQRGEFGRLARRPRRIQQPERLGMLRLRHGRLGRVDRIAQRRGQPRPGRRVEPHDLRVMDRPAHRIERPELDFSRRVLAARNSRFAGRQGLLAPGIGDPHLPFDHDHAARPVGTPDRELGAFHHGVHERCVDLETLAESGDDMNQPLDHAQASIGIGRNMGECQGGVLVEAHQDVAFEHDRCPARGAYRHLVAFAQWVRRHDPNPVAACGSTHFHDRFGRLEPSHGILTGRHLLRSQQAEHTEKRRYASGQRLQRTKPGVLHGISVRIHRFPVRTVRPGRAAPRRSKQFIAGDHGRGCDFGEKVPRLADNVSHDVSSALQSFTTSCAFSLLRACAHFAPKSMMPLQSRPGGERNSIRHCAR